MNLTARAMVVLSSLAQAALAGSWIRANRLGWHPDGAQKVTILSDSSLEGRAWTMRRQDGSVVSSGMLPKTTVAKGAQNPKDYGTVLSFGLKDTGTYSLAIAQADSQAIRVTRGGYSFLAQQALRHLRMVRSGPEQFLFRKPSHLGDSACPVRIPAGDWSAGTWGAPAKARTVDMTGGWYDAGDQIKFTLTIAYTTYYLLRAWETNPGIQSRWFSGSNLPDLLDEADFGLRYLEKTLVDDTTFVVEVGDGLDHSQGARLPENDALDGKRPALCALTPMPMAYTAASLALGARIFRERGDSAKARRWLATARRLDSLVSLPGASRKAAYWKDGLNDFYRDDTPYDNLALMATELWRATGDSGYLAKVGRWSDSAGVPGGMYYAEMGLTADMRLGSDRAMSGSHVRTSLAASEQWAQQNAPLWGIPGEAYWCPLQGWFATGAEAIQARTAIADTFWTGLGWDVFDYTLGRNNWGTSFFMSRSIPGSARNIFNNIYTLNDEFPTGAVAEGPGSRTVHESLSKYFSIGANEATEPFNTTTTVFYDNATDFQTMETVIAQQATFLYLLAGLTRQVHDTVPGAVPSEMAEPDAMAGLVPLALPLAQAGWAVYTDAGEKGISTAKLVQATDSGAVARLQVAVGTVLPYGYAGLDQTFGAQARALDWKRAKALRLRMDLPRGRSVRLQLRSSRVTDYDQFGIVVTGKGDTVYDIPFAKLAQRGFGKALGNLDPATVTDLDLLADQSGELVLAVQAAFAPCAGKMRR
jgi:endoglucanase